jgi:hypothetical protein
MGWAMLIGFSAFAAALLALLRFPGRMWMIPATAVTLAATGYVWQGSPGVEGHPVTTAKKGVEVDPNLVAMREAMFGRYTQSDAYFHISDAMVRGGSPELAAKAMLGAVTKAPTDIALWTWLGVTLTDSDGGMISPAARFAFDKAIAMGPTHPGPPYFLALALVRTGQYPEARAQLARALELTPATLEYRATIEDQLGRLDAFLGQGATSAP